LQILAKTFYGLEQTLADELTALGAKKIELLHRAVRFEGNQELLYRANFETRTALRYLIPIRTFKTKHENHLYKKMQEIDWAKYLNLKTTFAIDGVTSSKYITHSKYLALKCKDAIVDQLRYRFDGQRPYIDTQNPDLRINIHLSKENVCSVSLDSSGSSLHRRGYRLAAVEAPMNEALAAGLILLSGWKRDRAFVDPMCGSGTLPIEAALYARNIPPQWKRKEFGFEKWKDFDAALWKRVKADALAKVRDIDFPILGFDQDFNAFQIASKNIAEADMRDHVKVVWKKLEKLEHDLEEGIVIMNPPYDERLNEDDIEALYSRIGDQLKQKFTGFDAWIISANRHVLKHIGLRTSKKIMLYNGPLECRFHHYELYRGSKKAVK